MNTLRKEKNNELPLDNRKQNKITKYNVDCC